MRRIFMIWISIVVLGCTHQAELKSPDGKSIGKAQLSFSNNNSGTMVLNKNGTIYQGQWVSTKVDESNQIAKRYGIGSKKYQNYLQGKGEYLKSAQSTLKSSNGDVLNCEFRYRGTSAHGWCKSESESFEFIV